MKGWKDAHTTFRPTMGQVGQNILPPTIPPQSRCLPGWEAKKKNCDGQADEEVGTADVEGSGKHAGTSSFPHGNALDERSNQRQGAALPVEPTEALLGEDPDAALAHWLQQEEQITEAVQRGEDL